MGRGRSKGRSKGWKKGSAARTRSQSAAALQPEERLAVEARDELNNTFVPTLSAGMVASAWNFLLSLPQLRKRAQDAPMPASAEVALAALVGSAKAKNRDRKRDLVDLLSRNIKATTPEAVVLEILNLIPHVSG